MHPILQEFSASIPNKPYCTNNFVHGLKIRERESALSHKYVQYQIKNKITGWLAFDLDYEGAASAAYDANLPAPSITTINKANGHAHLLYKLTSPIPTSDRARQAPILYLNAIKKAYQTKLGADTGFAELITKNPLNDGWRTICENKSYELNELVEFVELPKLTLAMPVCELVGLGRNCSIFEGVRLIGYKLVFSHTDLNSFAASILALCESQNASFAATLSDREIKQIAKSISNWIWKHKDTIGNEISKEMILRIETECKKLLPNVDPIFVCKIMQKQLSINCKVDVSTIKRFMVSRGK